MKNRLLFLLLTCSPILFDTSYGASLENLPDAAARDIQTELGNLRLDEGDVKLSSGWELPYSLEPIEKLFGRPMDVGPTAAAWSDAVEAAPSMAALYGVAYDIVKSTPTAIPKFQTPAAPPFPNGIPAGLRPALSRMYGRLSEAQRLIEAAVGAVSKENRQGFLSLNEWPTDNSGVIKQEISSRRIRAKYEGMKTFRTEEMLRAGRIVIEETEALLKQLDGVPFPPDGRVTWKTPLGNFVIAGSADDRYEGDELKQAVVFIDLGGKNTYATPVGAARENQIRIAIDRGSDVTVEPSSETVCNAGCGAFGVGVLVLSNPAGVKKIESGSFAQGCGVAGVGALFSEGEIHLKGARYVQGAGTFGVGILNTHAAHKSTLMAERMGQGYGAANGAGFFVHQGDDAQIVGGLVEPDPREPLGSVSLCQGVGSGPRAYAGGGVGLASVRGDRVNVQGSYFSMGCGYWHALGIFRFRGNHSTLQARRYDLGSGVHSAFGHFDLYGNDNRVLNWAVGPAYGWDFSVGSAYFKGERLEIQGSWGMGTAAIGSYSFSYLDLVQSKLKLPGYGTGQFFRNGNAYGIHILRGADNQLQGWGSSELPAGPIHFVHDPWGLVRFDGIRLQSDLKLKEPDWPSLPRKETIQREMADLQAQIVASEQKAPNEQVGDLLDVAAAFSLDQQSPRVALGKLMALPAEKVPLVIDELDPAATDQLIQLQVVIAAHGPATTNAILEKLDSFPLQKKAILISLLRTHRPSLVFPALLNRLSSAATADDKRLRIAVMRTFGEMLNKDTGEEPGGRAIQTALAEYLAQPRLKSKKQAVAGLISKLIAGETFGQLAVAVDMTAEDRLELLKEIPQDVTQPVYDKAAAAFLKIAERDAAQNLERIKKNNATLDEMEPVVRKQLAGMIKSTQTAEATTAAVVLGQIANPEDTPLLVPLLDHSRAMVREAAAVALGRMGATAIPYLRETFARGSVRTRQLVLVAVSQSVSADAAPLLVSGMNDSDPNVRLTALSLVKGLPGPLQPQRKKLVALGKKKLKTETDPSVRLALSLLD